MIPLPSRNLSIPTGSYGTCRYSVYLMNPMALLFSHCLKQTKLSPSSTPGFLVNKTCQSTSVCRTHTSALNFTVIDIYTFNSQGTQSLICLASLINLSNTYWARTVFGATGKFRVECVEKLQKEGPRTWSIRWKVKEGSRSGMFNTWSQQHGEQRRHTGNNSVTTKCLSV